MLLLHAKEFTFEPNKKCPYMASAKIMSALITRFQIFSQHGLTCSLISQYFLPLVQSNYSLQCQTMKCRYKFGLTAETNSINSDEIVQSVSSYSGLSCEHRALLIGLCSVFVFISAQEEPKKCQNFQETKKFESTRKCFP